MKHYRFACPRSPAGLLIGPMLAGSIAIAMPCRSTAEEPPAPVPPAAAAAAPAEPAHPAGPRIVLLLPTSFTEYQNAVSGLEAIPDWTTAARKNLDEAAHEALEATGGLQLQALPELTPEESAILHDHIAVAQLIVGAGVQHKNGDWHTHRATFDRSFGDGLHFLHERTGADYALLIDGSQVRQSGGRAAMKWLGTLAAAAAGVIVVPTGGGGEVVNVCLLDLNQGTVTWFNSSRAVDLFASAGTDIRNPEATKAAMKKLFASYPAIPALTD
jgi:hypothetical protein